MLNLVFLFLLKIWNEISIKSASDKTFINENFYWHKCLLVSGPILVHVVLPAALWDRDYKYSILQIKKDSVLPKATDFIDGRQDWSPGSQSLWPLNQAAVPPEIHEQ